MNTIGNILLTTMLALTAVTASAGSGTVRTTKVDFADLDITQADGAQRLYRRLNAAAQQVCAPLEDKALARMHRYRICVRATLADAVAQVDQPLVTDIHHSSGNVRSVRVARR